jgi:predicted ATP-dependent endonuclease of OLD family
MVSQIRFKNFKLFKNWQTLEIKPITILIGKNNSGKTALLKLPAMIGESLKIIQKAEEKFITKTLNLELE